MIGVSSGELVIGLFLLGAFLATGLCVLGICIKQGIMYAANVYANTFQDGPEDGDKEDIPEEEKPVLKVFGRKTS